jgi:hypothetical protein
MQACISHGFIVCKFCKYDKNFIQFSNNSTEYCSLLNDRRVCFKWFRVVIGELESCTLMTR